MVIKKCNLCGSEFDMWDEQAGFGIKAHVGWGSKYDGEHIKLDLCCGCFDRVIEFIVPLCKINPISEFE